MGSQKLPQTVPGPRCYEFSPERCSAVLYAENVGASSVLSLCLVHYRASWSSCSAWEPWLCDRGRKWMVGFPGSYGVTGPQIYTSNIAPYHLFIYLKSTWQRAGSATYMSHSHQNHTYKSNTHKDRSNLKTKYNEIKNNDQYLVCIPRLALPKAFLNDSNIQN